MIVGEIIKILSGMGVDPELLQQTQADWQLRADLALTSAETTALYHRLKDLTGVSAPLWGEEDLSLKALSVHLSTGRRSVG